MPRSCRNAVVKVNNSIATAKSCINKNTKTYSCQGVPRSCMNIVVKVNNSIAKALIQEHLCRTR